MGKIKCPFLLIALSQSLGVLVVDFSKTPSPHPHKQHGLPDYSLGTSLAFSDGKVTLSTHKFSHGDLVSPSSPKTCIHDRWPKIVELSFKFTV